jgi:transketolase
MSEALIPRKLDHRDPGLARRIRASILRASHASGHGHVPTCFSIIEMLCAVYGTMRHDPANPAWEGRDIFVLSKGHASLGLYCTLAAFGYFDVAEVHSFGGFGSRFGCHSDRLKVPGVEVSTGSLGHGIGVAVGMALAERIRHSDRRVYALIGDGESNEGSVWEAVMVATDQRLANLTILYDANDSQTRCLHIPNPAERFSAFGCDVAEVNGHDVTDLESALGRRTKHVSVLVARTRKGFGSSTMMSDIFAWHRRAPNNEELERLLGELDAQAI